ncbi:hypothetical protein EV360DRAFT_74760 [Lentinula raphanica]|nr:hypothetical protein EV360DRAFT_74760 [Lentinula raphanica]
MIKEDIAIVVENQMQLRSRNSSLAAEIRNKLLDKADGGFRYIDCQLQTINGCALPKKVKAALATLPLDLKDTYDKVIATYKSEEDLEDIYHLFIWLLYSFEPVCISQVATILSFDLKLQTVESDTELLARLETIIDNTLVTVDHKNIVQFAHASVKEWLLQNQEDNHNRKIFNINAHLAHNIVKLSSARTGANDSY